ncbi:hypothetical protein TNCV_1470121 [Trichonephila clavipes]|nr:hypothetical protein TNCV_1470121 [Trichonephila clavipes]
MSSFQTSPGSAYSILVTVSGCFDEIARHLLLFDTGRGALQLVWWFRQPYIGYMTHPSLVRIQCNLNADRYISDILHPVVMPPFQGLSNASFQQNNARPHSAHSVLACLSIQGILLLP